MRKIVMRVIACILCACLLGSNLQMVYAKESKTASNILAGETTLKGIEYPGAAASYQAGPYYRKLLNVNLTGNQREDIVAVANSQVGYMEGGNKYDLSGTSNNHMNYTEYGNYIVGDGGKGLAWCAMFISWCAAKAKIEGNYNGERLTLELERNNFDSKFVDTEFNEKEHCFYGEFQLSEYGINGVYKITGYGLFGSGENSTERKDVECEWLDVEVSGLKEDSDKPLLDLSSVTMTSASGKIGEVALNEILYIFIPATDKTSGIDHIDIYFWKYNETTQLWEENMLYCYNKVLETDNGYTFLCRFSAQQGEGKYYIQHIGVSDYAENVTSYSTIMDYGDDKGNIIPEYDMDNLRLTVTPVSSYNSNNVCNMAGHDYKEVTVVATTSSDGYTADVCSVCGTVDHKNTLYKINAINLKYEKNTYTGKEQKPDVVVKDSTGRVLSKDCYTVTYSNNKNVGQAKVTVTFKNNYKGTVVKTVTILPKGTSIKKVTSKKKGFTVRWKKQDLQATGYEIQYSTSSKFKGAKTLKNIKSKTTSKSVTKLKAKKKYYVRIRTYKTIKINGKSVKLYSDWSKVKEVTTKK